MGTFENYMQENRSNFDDADLLPGHMDRFLKKQSSHKLRLSLWTTLSAAASIAVILMLTALLSVYYNNQFTNEFANSSSKNDRQLYEIEAYYRSQLLIRYKAIEQIAETTNPQAEKDAKQLISDFEKEKISLKTEYDKTPQKELLLGAMYQSYQAQIDALDRIQKSLEEEENK